MVKKAFLLLAASACLASTVKAQVHCFTDEKQAELRAAHPEIAIKEAELKALIDAQMKFLNPMMKTTESGINDTERLYIPVVFHLVHDYGAEYVSDNMVFEAVKEINAMFNGVTSDTAGIINPYKNFIPGTSVRYKGKSNITFKLATKDPNGNPTHGITRRRSYLATNASDQAKYEIWPQNRYMNIWIVRTFDLNHEGAAAYAYKPVTADVLPWVDGVIGTLQNNEINYDNTLAHELAHSLNLDHTWGGTNKPDVDCGDDDVDDTPPTKGHNPTNCGNLTAIYDTTCTFKSHVFAKLALDNYSAVVDSVDNRGIGVTTFSKINLDQLTFYPSDSGKPYTIVLKHKVGNTYNVVDSYSGTTTNNKYFANVGKPSLDVSSAMPDSTVGVGVRFRAFDSLIIRSVKIYPQVLGEPFTIVLKRNNTALFSASGVTDDLNGQTVNLDFSFNSNDSGDVFSLEFADNPYANRDTNTNQSLYSRVVDGALRFIDDTTGVRYNFFYDWNVTAFNYAQVAPVAFLLPRDTANNAYRIEFSDNPGAKRDPGTTTNNTVTDGIMLTADTDQGLYNYFYNWKIRTDYFKFYSPAEALHLFGDATKTYIDYPDTVNSQNVMDYTYCSKMFTYLQTVRMRNTLQNSVAFRNNLVTSSNLALTGALDPWPDLAPVADFSTDKVFACANTAATPDIAFRNRSWNDTVGNVVWTFGSNAANPTITQTGAGINTQVNNKFGTPGWASVSLIANSNAGSDTFTNDKAVYIADPTAMDPNGYIEEFTPGANLDKYPTFDYYNTPDHKWEFVTNAGTFDNTSIRFKNFDKRSGTETYIGTPKGDFGDLYTPAFDIRAMGNGPVYLNFFSAGAFRTNLPNEMLDSIQISYSINCGGAWTTMKTLTKAEISNNGVRTTEFTPTGALNWQPQSIVLPAAIRGSSNVNASRVFFRIRYKVGADAGYFGTGNHFYLDRLHLSNWTASVSMPQFDEKGVVLAPNPTTGSTFVIIKGSKASDAQVVVTDIAGKVVYSTQASLSGDVNRVEIPASYLSVKGVYLVQVVTGSSKHTEKLVVY